MRQALDLSAKTFFTLLGEGNKQELFDLKRLIMAATFPHLDAETQEQIKSSLITPDDILRDTLEDEKADDIEKVKQAFEG